MSKFMSKANERAFTLLELLYVMIMIAVLASIVIPKFNKTVARSKFGEIKTIVELIAASAAYFDARNGLDTILAGGGLILALH